MEVIVYFNKFFNGYYSNIISCCMVKQAWAMRIYSHNICCISLFWFFIFSNLILLLFIVGMMQETLHWSGRFSLLIIPTAGKYSRSSSFIISIFAPSFDVYDSNNISVSLLAVVQWSLLCLQLTHQHSSPFLSSLLLQALTVMWRFVLTFILSHIYFFLWTFALKMCCHWCNKQFGSFLEKLEKFIHFNRRGHLIL